jgi:hypothetical protein
MRPRSIVNRRIKGPLDPRDGAEPTGRVAFDERGNAVWQWSEADASDRLLDGVELTIAEDDSPPSVIENRRAKVAGYDPYGSGLISRKTVAENRRRDLRELSKWIELRRKLGSEDKD